jgi:hypothetical protein
MAELFETGIEVVVTRTSREDDGSTIARLVSLSGNRGTGITVRTYERAVARELSHLGRKYQIILRDITPEEERY